MTDACYPTARAFTLRLAAFVVSTALALNGLVWLASPEPYRQTALSNTWDVLRGQSGDDSWGAMFVALEHVQVMPEVPLYSEIFFKRHYRYQYPPSSLMVLQAMLMAGPEYVRLTDDHQGAWPTINDVGGWLCLALTAICLILIFERRMGGRLAGDNAYLKAARALLGLGLTLTFYPVVKAYTLGQIQVLINALFALSVLNWIAGWRASSGVLLGLIGLMKPHYGVILLWAAFRKEWRFLAGACAVLALGGIASILMYGFANHLDYLRVLSFLSQHGETYFPNQSVNGILNRLAALSAKDLYVVLDLPAGKFPPFNPWIYAATLGSTLALLTYGMTRTAAACGGDSTRALGIMALCATMASPIAWEHHYGITLPLFAVAATAALPDRRTVTVLMLSYVLVATFFQATNLLAQTWLNILQSTLFIGALLLLWVLSKAEGPPADEGPTKA